MQKGDWINKGKENKPVIVVIQAPPASSFQAAAAPAPEKQTANIAAALAGGVLKGTKFTLEKTFGLASDVVKSTAKIATAGLLVTSIAAAVDTYDDMNTPGRIKPGTQMSQVFGWNLVKTPLRVHTGFSKALDSVEKEWYGSSFENKALCIAPDAQEDFSVVPCNGLGG